MAKKKPIQWPELSTFMSMLDRLPQTEYEIASESKQRKTFEYLRVTQFNGEILSEPLPRIYRKQKEGHFTVSIHALEIYSTAMAWAGPMGAMQFPGEKDGRVVDHDVTGMTDEHILMLIRDKIGLNLSHELDRIIHHFGRSMFEKNPPRTLGDYIQEHEIIKRASKSSLWSRFWSKLWRKKTTS